MPHVPDVGDADLAAEVDEHFVLHDIHATFEGLDLVGALVHDLLDRANARLQNKNLLHLSDAIWGQHFLNKNREMPIWSKFKYHIRDYATNVRWYLREGGA